jgi:hypothetical protein
MSTLVQCSEEDPVGIADELERLAELHRTGALNDEEYEAAKRHALAGTTIEPAAHDGDASPTLAPPPAARTERTEGVVQAPHLSVGTDRDVTTRRTWQGRRARWAIGIVVVALVTLVVSVIVVSNGGGGGGESIDCSQWDTTQGQWYSVPQALINATDGSPRMVDTNAGVWTSPAYGGENGWTYAAKTPNGVAFWGVIGNTEGSIWYVLNPVASNISQSIGMSADQPASNISAGMLDSQIRQTLTQCVGG